jgi:hypothetical protein
VHGLLRVAATTIADAIAQGREFEQMGASGILAILKAYFPLSTTECSRICIKGARELQDYAVGAPLPPQARLPADAIEDVKRTLIAIGAL